MLSRTEAWPQFHADIVTRFVKEPAHLLENLEPHCWTLAVNVWVQLWWKQLLVFTESALINGHGGSQKKHTAVQARMEKDTTQQLHWGLGVVEAQAAKAENTSERRKGQEPHGACWGLGRGCCSLAAGGVEMPHTGGEVVGVSAAMEGKQQDIIAKKI